MPLADLIPVICGRPHMFIRSGTFEEALTFLEGYNAALIDFASKEVRATNLMAFGIWLSRTHENADGVWQINGEEVTARLAWSSKFRRLYPADEKAFEALPRLYQQFLDDLQSRI